jgi:hydroxyethylthiazole kinase-like uncharacterized protein yjeF
MVTFTSSPSFPIYATEDVRQIEARAADEPLMERAGHAAAELARDRLLEGRKSVLVLAGPGNNGGDGFVLARQLKSWWYRVTVLFAGERARLPTDARAAHDAWLAADGHVLRELPAERFDLVVDALFGIGLEREIEGQWAELIAYVNRQPAPVLALDIPSGLHGDSGRVLGHAVEADHTATYIALKPGLLTLDGPDHAGELHVFDLGLDAESLHRAPGRVIGSALLREALPTRRRNSHKGTYGTVGIVGGAPGMTGAALLAGRAALRLGAGRIHVGMLDAEAPHVDVQQAELMLRDAAAVSAMEALTCMVVGPGLGQSAQAHGLLASALERKLPLVLDADALNLLAADDALRRSCAARSAGTVLTPHPAEAARLLAIETAQIQHDRIAAAVKIADRYGCACALKGTGTVVAIPDWPWFINTTGNAGLASAGMGDVLSGILGALLAQGVEPASAVLAAVHLHGLAADTLLEDGIGPIGMTGSEVTDAARAILNAAVYAAPSQPSVSAEEEPPKPVG